MSLPFVGEVRFVSFNFPPRGWAACNGQLLPINQNQALFAILGTAFGGNGQTTFGLPNLQGRVPQHRASGGAVGAIGGEATHTLAVNEMPSHNHSVMASLSGANNAIPATRVLAASAPVEFKLYATSASPATPLRSGTIAPAGGSQAHPNMQPYLALNAIIALQGIYPTRS